MRMWPANRETSAGGTIVSAAFATKGYFAKQRNRRGRQLGRVLATHYHELVTEQLLPGTEQLAKALRPLVEATEQVLELDEARRAQTLIRVDAGVAVSAISTGCWDGATRCWRKNTRASGRTTLRRW